MFDILLSTIIGSTLMLSIFSVGSNLSDVSYQNNFDYAVQLSALDFSQALGSDFNKIGYRTPKPAITAADTSDITFRSDITNTHTIATIRYYEGSPSEVPQTKNPYDRPLNKQTNAGSIVSNYYGLTMLHFTYYDSAGTQLPTPVAATKLQYIKSIKVQAILQSTISFDTTYAEQYWERTFFPQNL
jgi:hypothetical protein